MRIQFKQQGGAMPPYISYRPFTPVSSSTPSETTTQSTTTTTKQSSDEGLKDKDLMTMLKDIDGLPNDMQIVISNLKSMYDLQTIAPSAATGLVSMYLNSLLKSKTANFNKKQYDNAYKEVNDNKGLSEVAISDRGNVFATDENNKPYELSIEEYVKILISIDYLLILIYFILEHILQALLFRMKYLVQLKTDQVWKRLQSF